MAVCRPFQYAVGQLAMDMGSVVDPVGMPKLFTSSALVERVPEANVELVMEQATVDA